MAVWWTSLVLVLTGMFTLFALHEMYPEHPVITMAWVLLRVGLPLTGAVMLYRIRKAKRHAPVGPERRH